MPMLCYNNSTMKKIKAFTLFELLMVIAIVAILAAMAIPMIAFKKNHDEMQKAGILFNVGDTVYIETLSVTGVVNHMTTIFDQSTVNLIVKSTNGVLSEFNGVDTRLLKKVPPTPESEWKR